MEEVKLIAKKRDLKGSANAGRLRRRGGLPGVIYGSGMPSTPVELDKHEVELLLHHHASETMLVDVELEGEGTFTALIKEVQHHPVSDELLHIDLQKVDAAKTIRVEIQLEFVGEAAGVKAGGTLEPVLHELAVECLPRDLVETFEVDVSGLEIGDTLHVSDLNLGDRYKVLEDPDAVVVTVAGPHAEEEAEAEEGAEEPEVIKEKKEEE